MFHLYDFLIYCFITAYTPGANNLLSMSNAIRLGFRRSIRFNLGILAGFSVVMAVCTAFSATLYSYLPRVKQACRFWAPLICCISHGRSGKVLRIYIQTAERRPVLFPA